VIVAQRGFPDWWLDFWNSVSKGHGVCGTALEARHRVIVEDVERSPIFDDPRAREIQLRAGVRAVQSTPLLGRGGVPLGMISTHFKKPHRPPDDALRLLDLLARQAADILERISADEALRKSEARFSGILAVSPDAIISMDDALHITLWNDGAEEMYGYSRDEAIGAPLAMIIPERWRAAYLREVKAFANGPEVSQRLGDAQTTYVGLRKNGGEFPVDVGISKLQVADEHILTVSIRDMTDQKRLESEQRALARLGQALASNLDYESTLTQVVQLVAEELADFAVLYLRENDHPPHRARMATREPSGNWYRDRVSGLRADAAGEHPVARAIAAKQTLVLNVDGAVIRSLAHTEDHARALERLNLRSVMAVPLIIGDACVGALLLKSATRDYGSEDLRLAEEIARRTALLIENARLHRTAQSAIRARDNVLSIVAHDLRNPLGSIVMEAGALQMGEEGGKRGAREAAASIQRAANQMRRLIRDLLDIARIESGPLSIERSRVPVAAVIGDFVKGHEAIASSASLHLDSDIAANVGDVDADPDRLVQVLENLVGNSERHTSKGGRITIGAKPRDEEVLFWVSDTGPGIEADALPHLFDRFSEKRKADHRGTGLGLPIVKGIIEAHGGRVWAESAIGKGSTFFFTLPKAAPRQQKARRREGSTRAKIKLDK
jgi:PAS domain S-box-containing protein